VGAQPGEEGREEHSARGISKTRGGSNNRQPGGEYKDQIKGGRVKSQRSGGRLTGDRGKKLLLNRQAVAREPKPGEHTTQQNGEKQP